MLSVENRNYRFAAKNQMNDEKSAIEFLSADFSFREDGSLK